MPLVADQTHDIVSSSRGPRSPCSGRRPSGRRPSRRGDRSRRRPEFLSAEEVLGQSLPDRLKTRFHLARDADTSHHRPRKLPSRAPDLRVDLSRGFRNVDPECSKILLASFFAEYTPLSGAGETNDPVGLTPRAMKNQDFPILGAALAALRAGLRRRSRGVRQGEGSRIRADGILLKTTTGGKRRSAQLPG
jgi:hypothetical protein